MEYDYSSICDAVNKIMKFTKEIAELITNTLNEIRPYIKEIWKFMQLSTKKELNEKVKHNPIRNIKPNKAIMLRKRTNVYYCRNNC